jgi:hypothetical protein
MVPRKATTAAAAAAAPAAQAAASTDVGRKPLAAVKVKGGNDPIIGVPINRHYTIGSFLGAGEFGRVYAIHPNNDNNNDLDNDRASTTNANKKSNPTKDVSWAVKIVSRPTIIPKSSKKAPVSSFDRLHFEYLMYTQHFRHLCGTILPKLPSPLSHQLECFYATIPMPTNPTEGTNCIRIMMELRESLVVRCRHNNFKELTCPSHAFFFSRFVPRRITLVN